jgi:TonB family protein
MRSIVFASLVAVFSILSYHPSYAQATARKLKSRVEPQYPELARRNNVRGSTRLELIVAPDGKVKDVKVLGGSPVLIQAAVAAAMKWKFESALEESSVIIKFDFNP